MRLLFVTPELAPYTGASTSASDTSWALPKALKARGHECVVLCPLYGFIDPVSSNLARRLRTIAIDTPNGKSAFTVFDARTAAGVDLLFLGHEDHFAPCESYSLIHETDAAGAARFGAFCQAAIEVILTDDAGFDAVHCHGWQAALVPGLLDEGELSVPTVLTVHANLQHGAAQHGASQHGASQHGPRDLSAFGLGADQSFLENGIRNATAVTTVAPSLATALREDAAGLEAIFTERGGAFTGIAGGLDVAVWNPATDPHLASRFDPMDMAGKARCKSALQEEVGFPLRVDVPLIAVIAPNVGSGATNGVDGIARIAGRSMRNDVQVVIVTEDDEPALGTLQEHNQRWPDRLAVQTPADATKIHRALGAADFVLLPADGGMSNLHLGAQRYGALPIGRRAGALLDSIVDCDATLTTGSGILFDEHTDDTNGHTDDTNANDTAMLGAVQRAIAAFTLPTIARLRTRIMRADHSWERAGYLYERLYASVVPERPGAAADGTASEART